MTDYNYDVLILGAGPAGESAALNSIKHHMKTAVIDNLPQVGGACTHSGTIPSKALRSVVKTLLRYNSNPLIRDIGGSVDVKFPQLLNHVKEVVRQQVRMRSKFYRRNGIDLYKGQGVLVDAHTVRLDLDDGAEEFFTAKSIIIATGSRPFREPTVDFSHPRIFDSDSILTLQYTPRKILIFGAGVIGCEYASLFAGLGTKVDLVNTRERLLEFLDGEISDALSYHLRNQGVMVRHKEALSHVEATDTGVTLYLVSGKRLQADALLWCSGRTGNTDNLGLDAVGIGADHRGYLSVNHRYQTSVENIYAVGDAIGWPSLASAAYNQGRTASAVVRGKENCSFVDDVPTGIYTLPEISSVGKTERELTEACIPYEVGRAFFKETARGQISGEDSGMLKILFHTGTLEVLGIHCFGSEATEIIHIGQAIMKQQGEGNTIRYFVTTTFNYPTMAEAYRIAALNGLNRMQL